MRAIYNRVSILHREEKEKKRAGLSEEERRRESEIGRRVRGGSYPVL